MNSRNSFKPFHPVPKGLNTFRSYPERDKNGKNEEEQKGDEGSR